MKKLFIFTLMFSMILTNAAFAAPTSSNDDELTAVTEFVNEVYPNISDAEKAELIQKLYEERTQASSSTRNAFDNTSEVYIQEEDPAYIAMLEKENYIVDLINDMGSSATRASWEDNLEFLTDNYNEIQNTDNINMNYVDSYISDYSTLRSSSNMPSEKVFSGISLFATGYYYEQAVSYAKNYYINFNSNYPDWTDWGGDCANFASQCLYAGGKTMRGTDPTDAKSWFSSGTANSTTKVAGAWRGANMFKNYWKVYAPAYKQFSSGGIDTYNYTWPGDVVSLLNDNGAAYHTLICVSYNSSDKSTTLYSHTGTPSRNLSNVTVPLIVYHMRDSY